MVTRRPARSPVFQIRKESGMNIAVLIEVTEWIEAAKTGKPSIVAAKQMNTPAERKGSLRKRGHRAIDARPGFEREW